MTQLTITPKISDKTARFKGTIAAGEHVAVTIKGGAEWIGTDSGANLTLRVLDLVTGRTLAVFPYWTEDNQDDWPEDVTSADAWETSGDDNADLSCTLNLNTLRMVAAARHMLRVPVMFVLGDTDDPRTLYFRDRYEVEYWPERIGDTVPYDLDKWPKQIDDWTELVTGWTAKLNGMKLTAAPFTGKVVSGVSKNGVTITLNDGDDTTDTVVDLFDGEVSAAQMNAAIAAMGSTKQNTLTFDDIPTAESDNPVKSGGVKAAIDEVADDLTEHTGNTDIHVIAEQKTAWTAKYNKPQGGIPKSDLASAVQASLAKADTAVQVHQDLSEYVNGAVYDSNAKSIKFKHDTTVLFDIDATAFIKDGMVDSVEIIDGNLVISFNTDAGIEDIEIPLTDIFNPSNYYDKTAADGRFVQKEAGKGIVAVDATLATSGAAADAKAVGDALAEKASAAGVFLELDGTEVGGFEVPNLSVAGVGTSVVESNGVIDNYAIDAVGNLYVLDTIEWTLDGVAQDDVRMTAENQYTVDGSGDYALLSPAYGFGSGTGEIAVINGYSIRINFSVDGQGVYSPVIVAYDSGGNFDHFVYGDGGVTMPFDGKFSYSFEYGGHAFAMRAKKGAYSFLMTHGKFVREISEGWAESKANKVSSLSAQSTHAQYPSAKCVHDALAQKANASDLPYRLVEPGKWEFSGIGVQSGVVYGVDESESDGYWVYTLIADSENVDDYTSSERLDSVSFSGAGVTATRNVLHDRAGNRVEVSGDTTLTLPAAVAGYARDFLVRLEISGSTVPTITFAAPTGETLTYETDGDEFPVPDEAGDWLYSFTESCVAHKFAVSLKKVNEVAAPQAQGGS